MKELKELGISIPQLKRIIGGKKYKPHIIKKALTEKKFHFGVVADTHLCSNYEALDELHTFYAICKKQGIKHILHAGDLIAGWGIYRGQENEVHTFGAMNQAAYAIKNYPKVKGITTYFITGNHCLSWWKQAGIDIGEIVAKERPDMIYLGQYAGNVTIGGVKIRLVHPDSGIPYALSYTAQRLAVNIPSGDKPHVFILGHMHTAIYFFYRNMHILHAGCFESQSSFLLRKGLNPAIGGWIAEVRISNDKQKSLVAFKPAWIPFFK